MMRLDAPCTHTVRYYAPCTYDIYCTIMRYDAAHLSG